MEELTKPTPKNKINYPLPNLTRHKYKVEQGKKAYTFKNQSDISKTIGISNKKMKKIINGELDVGLKISRI